MKKSKLHLHLLEQVAKLDKNPSWKRLEPEGLFNILQASDCILMNAYQVAASQPVTDLDTDGGSLDLGHFLYRLHHPPFGLKLLTRRLVDAMESAEGQKLPPSQFTPESWQAMQDLVKKEGIAGPAGEIFGNGKYEQLDHMWLFALFMFVIHELGVADRHPFGTTPNIIDVPAGRPMRIAVIGDWGTGKFGKDGGPAVAVMKGIERLQPDYIIHLGDVYYAGTGPEESDFLVGLWPPRLDGNRSFTLNSNHEMYDGANGYFKQALKKGGPFSAQQQTSYFALRHGEWLFLGLDSAYYSNPKKLFMKGCIGGAAGAQGAWIREHFKDQDPEKTVVFTHHSPVSIAGDEITGADDPDSLWNEVVAALGGRAPGTWYFGHIHNAAVYSKNSALGKAGCRGRLAGHGAIPYGESFKLNESYAKDLVDYFAKTRLNPAELRVRNGFAMIGVDAGGVLSEGFYEVADGSDTAHQVWP
jgi:hypothetical protein